MERPTECTGYDNQKFIMKDQNTCHKMNKQGRLLVQETKVF